MLAALEGAYPDLLSERDAIAKPLSIGRYYEFAPAATSQRPKRCARARRFSISSKNVSVRTISNFALSLGGIA